MKQRVGIARAMITGPEILCMDEPFSALDVLTGETLRNEIGRLYADPSTGLHGMAIVTHNIAEAVFLTRRIVVLAAHPGRVQGIVHNDLPYPRNPESEPFRRMVEQIHSILTKAMMPDQVTEAAATAEQESHRRLLTPLPPIGITELIGLIRFLHDEREDSFELTKRIGREFGAMLSVIHAAEMLDLVRTPGDFVELTAKGRELRQDNVQAQKIILKQQILTLPLFQQIIEWIDIGEDGQSGTLSINTLQERLATLFPNEKPKPLMRTILQWGRYAEILTQDNRLGIVRRYEKSYFGKPSITSVR